VLDQHYYLLMLSPEPKKFASDITLTSENKEEIALTLEVNKPYKYSGWKLYQQSYDDRMGKWSKVSIVEAVRDPWLPVVYFGIFLLLAGAVYLFWIGREIKES
jgi:cytochrome c biogenesis protein ResB